YSPYPLPRTTATPITRINQISPTVGGLLSLSSRLFKAAHAGQTTMHTPAPMPAVARPPPKTRSIRLSLGMVLPPNERANLPGPLRRLHAARNRKAAPVKFSDWLAAAPLQSRDRINGAAAD